MEFLLLFWEYFKIGLFTLGGGYAMLPMVEQVVLRNGWMLREELINFIGVAESTPGPFAVNLATFVGMQVGMQTNLGVFGGYLGSAVATFAVVLPSLVIIIIVTRILDKFKTNRHVQNALKGVRPVVVGMVASAMFTIFCAVVFPKFNLDSPSLKDLSDCKWISLLIFLVFVPVSRLKIKGKKLHPIFMICISAVLGILLFGVFNIKQ